MTPKSNEKQFTVNLDTDILECLKSMAEHADISRHKLMVNLLTTGIEQIEVMKHVGIFQLGLLIRNMTDTPEKAKARKTVETKNSEMPIPLRIDKKYLERLERLAEKGEINRQRLAQNIIKVGLENLEDAKKIGLTHVVIKIRDMQDLFTDILEVGKQAFYAGKEVITK
jgi:predicted transcriptional regulator